MTALFYTAYHAPAPLLDSRCVKPIHVGRALATAALPGMIGDDTGASISDLNQSYCELTALYWAWQNDHDHSHIGLMHYRRVLDVAGTVTAPQAEVFVDRFDIPTWLEQTDRWCAQVDTDIVLPRRHVMDMSVAQNYGMRSQSQDLTLTRQVIADHHADWLVDFDTEMAGNSLYLANIALMRRDILDRYCTWLFDILERVAAAPVDRSHYSPYQSRFAGFLAERLLGVFIRRLRREEPELAIAEVNIINTSGAMVLPYIADDSLNGPAHVNVAFAADRAYLPHTAAMLQSLLDHADRSRQINLFFLYTDITPDDLNLLKEVIKVHPRAVLHNIPAGNPFGDSYRSQSRAPSNATYNRFLLFDLLPTLDRLLYIDTDMICMGDIVPIFDTQMGDHQIAAVPDYIMTRTVNGPTQTANPNIDDMADYQRNVLGMNPAQMAGYFNAGLLLLNFAKMDVRATGAQLIKMAQTGQYLFRDQDILNAHFKDSLLHLPARCNVFNSEAAAYDRVPAANHAAAMAAKADPLIIHYAAGDYKPWNGQAQAMAQHYWAALIRTPFYAEVVVQANEHARMARQRAKQQRRQVVNIGRGVSHRLPMLRAPLIRVYNLLRRIDPKWRRG